jgi:hypothetical protein
MTRQDVTWQGLIFAICLESEPNATLTISAYGANSSKLSSTHLMISPKSVSCHGSGADVGYQGLRGGGMKWVEPIDTPNKQYGKDAIQRTRVYYWGERIFKYPAKGKDTR